MKNICTEEQLDYLNEMMNIGAGNAATALSQMFQTDIEIEVARLRILSEPNDISSLFSNPSTGLTGMRMKLLGDVMGDAYFVVEDRQRPSLVHLGEKTIAGCNMPYNAAGINEFSVSVLSETANILAGVFTTAIFDFCRLAIFHSVPALVMETAKAFVDMFFASNRHDNKIVILVENKFVVSKEQVAVWFILAIDEKYLNTLLDSIKKTGLS